MECVFLLIELEVDIGDHLLVSVHERVIASKHFTVWSSA